jgi:hypothetical protein
LPEAIHSGLLGQPRFYTVISRAQEIEHDLIHAKAAVKGMW